MKEEETVRWKCGKSTGEPVKLTYDLSKKPIEWDCEEGEGLKPMLKEYFETPIEFHLPESQRIDDYRTEKKRPIDDPDAFNAALNTMRANICIERVF